MSQAFLHLSETLSSCLEWPLFILARKNQRLQQWKFILGARRKGHNKGAKYDREALTTVPPEPSSPQQNIMTVMVG